MFANLIFCALRFATCFGLVELGRLHPILVCGLDPADLRVTLGQQQDCFSRQADFA
jgi:hypothetical protein